MSVWTDKILTDYSITTGDGKEYTPYSLYMTWNFNYDFLVTPFNFKGVRGTLVKRGEAQGEVYNIEIIFQGGDNLDLMTAFKESSKDKRAWTILHPFYGKLHVQPFGLRFDNSKLNQTVITGTVMQTILDSGASVSQNRQDVIAAQATTVMASSAKSMDDMPAVTTDPAVQSKWVDNSLTYIKSVQQKVVGKVQGAEALVAKYTTAYVDAVTHIANQANYSTLEIVQSTQFFLTSPAYFTSRVSDRMGLFTTTLGLLQSYVDNIMKIYNKPTKELKRQYEVNGLTALCGICLSAVTNITDDYMYRPDVLDAIKAVVDSYNSYVVNLYNMQSQTGGDTDSYMPDVDSITSLTQLVRTTTQFLYTTSTGALQQRTYTAQYDTNSLLVAFELFPDQNPEETALTLMGNNNIHGDEIFTIKKDRELVYYI